MKNKENYEDYSSGRVLYGAPGATNFPVSLIDEIFLKCSDYLIKKGNLEPWVVYDPCCGAGYSLTVLGFMHGLSIKQIFASDIDKTILEFAHKNLSILHTKGIDKRIRELKKFIEDYQKESHKQALGSAERLKTKTQSLSISINEFRYDMLSTASLPKQVSEVDIVIADVPYGQLTSWRNLKDGVNPIQTALDKIRSRLSPVSIVAIILNKKQEILYEGFTKIKSFKSGKRKVILLGRN